MSTVTVPTAVVRTRRRVRRGSYFGPRFWMGVIVTASAVAVALSTAQERAVVLPAMVMIDVSAIFFLELYRRDRKLPVFEIGALWVLVALLYSVFPLLNFYVGGLRWTIVSDNRLWAWDVDAYETGRFSWLFVICAIPFMVTYLLVRKRAAYTATYTAPVGRSRVIAVVVAYFACGLMLMAVARYFGITFDPSYADLAAEKVQTLHSLPFVMQQAVHYLLPLRLLLVQIMLFIAMRHWRDWRYRAAIGLFFAFQIGRTLYVGGARTELTLLLITFVLLYHRVVKPLTFKVATVAAVLVVIGFNLLGLLRAPGYLDAMKAYNIPRLAAVNEFQIVWGTSYDLWRRKQLGILGDVPWQLPYSDFYYLVPSQLLPFEKIDTNVWYIEMSGFDGGLMFGLVAQAMIGFGWKQLFLEGIVLGYLAAKLHRWYVKRAQRFWPLIFYLFCCIWIYYSMRQTALAMLSFIEYEFVPALIMVELVRMVMQRAHTQARKLIRARTPVRG